MQKKNSFLAKYFSKKCICARYLRRGIQKVGSFCCFLILNKGILYKVCKKESIEMSGMNDKIRCYVS